MKTGRPEVFLSYQFLGAAQLELRGDCISSLKRWISEGRMFTIRTNVLLANTMPENRVLVNLLFF